MDKVEEGDEPVPATELRTKDPRSPVRRRVRRRLVQSTLFVQKPPGSEENGDQKDDRIYGKDEDGEDEDFCRSQSRNKRKPKGKTMPQTRASKKSKEKRPVNTTPKKTLTNSVKCESASPPIPDLRLEAKMSAEENSRMFAGKQIHPFFSSWKVGKKNQDATEAEGSWCMVEGGDKGITCGPIHVFEMAQDNKASLDWKNWTFCDGSFVENTSLLVHKSFVGPLLIDKLPIVSYPCDVSTLHNEVTLDLHHSQLDHSPELDYELDKLGLSSGHTSTPRKLDIKEQCRFLQESNCGMMSCNADPGNQLKDNLWTYKYKPKKAVEVCGNEEAVKFLSDWLCLWRAKVFRPSKDQAGGGQCNVRDDDYYCSQNNSDSEDMDKDATLKNVLLVTGPVGSGKSAAIYACAQEQGFEVLELSASDCRNGALVKQRFGEALESRWLKRPSGHIGELSKKDIVNSPLAIPKGEEEFENHVVEVISLPDEEASHDRLRTPAQFVNKVNGIACYQGEVKPLILFEDVDITFLEDRGFVAAIQQIAETAKGPLILTSNSNDPLLPDNLDRLQVCFTLPSSKELLRHAYMVCAAEGFSIHPNLLERLVVSCHGDIRKIIMHLQFWCQGKRFSKEKELQKTYGSLLFDVEAAHQILPKIIPWEFPSQLSELIEEEMTRSLSMMDESSGLLGMVEKELDKNLMQKGLDTNHNEKQSVETKKLAMLKMNGSVEDCDEFTAPFDELTNSSGTPIRLSRRSRKSVVLSSDSEDEYLSIGCPVVLDKNIDNDTSLGVNNNFPSGLPLKEKCFNPLTEKILSRVESLEERGYQFLRQNYMQIDETCQSLDVSCVPESSFVPETVIGDVTELLSRTVSCGHVSNTIELSVSNDSIRAILPVEEDNLDKSIHRWENNCDMNPEISHIEAEEDSQDVNVDGTRGYQVMDECSRMDFDRPHKFVEKLSSMMVPNLVQESWIKIRSCRTNLRPYVAAGQHNAIEGIKLAYGMSSLISEADVLLSSCPLVGSLEPSKVPSEGSETFNWCDEQIQMTSTIAQHGFCFYAKDIAAVGSKIACESSVDLAAEMLASTSNMMALGKLAAQDMRGSRTLHGARCSETSAPKNDCANSEIKSSPFDIIHSIIPARSYLNVRDVALCEYISSLRHISRAEASRLSEGIYKTRRRRGRAARHYLCTGSLMLSPDDILLLDQPNFSEKNSFQS